MYDSLVAGLPVRALSTGTASLAVALVHVLESTQIATQLKSTSYKADLKDI